MRWKHCRKLKAAGLHVVAITGRPWAGASPLRAAGRWMPSWRRTVRWLCSHCPAKGWSSATSRTRPPASATTPACRKCLPQIEREVPGARRATDSPGRETDIAIDHSEFTHLPQQGIDEAVRIMRAAGMNATVSSIHINGWFGRTQARRCAVDRARVVGPDLDAEMDAGCT